MSNLFPDDQPKGENAPKFHVERTLGLVERVKGERGQGQWLYLKGNPGESPEALTERILKFYENKTGPGATVKLDSKDGLEAAVWMGRLVVGTKPEEEKRYPPNVEAFPDYSDAPPAPPPQTPPPNGNMNAVGRPIIPKPHIPNSAPAGAINGSCKTSSGGVVHYAVVGTRFTVADAARVFYHMVSQTDDFDVTNPPSVHIRD